MIRKVLKMRYFISLGLACLLLNLPLIADSEDEEERLRNARMRIPDETGR